MVKLKSVLVIGSGGREHAIAWGLANSDPVGRVYCMPGNGGTAYAPKMENVPFRSSKESVDFAARHSVALTVVGPEGYLAQGIVDRFQAAGLKIFGPTQATTRLESSKVFASEFAHRHGIPIPHTHVSTDYASAHKYLAEREREKFFIKADELCGGKGAIFAPNQAAGEQALRFLLQERACGVGERVLLQEAIAGEEVSVMVITDGANYRLLPLVRDYKRLEDGDRGANTGGMGAYAPVDLPREVMKRIERLIIGPTIHGMAEERLDDAAIIYFGVMVDQVGDPYLLEYNMRFGDPEIQALLPLLKSDLYKLLHAACTGKLDQATLEWRVGATVCVVAACAGYPTDYGKESLPISGLSEAADEGATIFHAATDYHDSQWYTCGGRILGVTARRETLGRARESAYAAMERVRFDGMRYRRDIALREGPCAV
ncbi:MAG: phosphoribosylamine--glycine ligase [Candidatus Bipolaricaulota bacterium]|nr:phosphoribosylamine--glycine ligase [Candidatus Bipolaricaulota bacterium]